MTAVAACTSSSDSGGAASTTAAAAVSSTSPDTTAATVPPTSAPPTTRPGPQPCSPSSLALASGEGRSALGHALHVFRLRNTSQQACRLAGYPAVTLLDGQGRVLAEAKPGAGSILPDRPPADVSLAPGAAGYFGVESSTLCDGDAAPTPSARVSVTPPQGTGALSAAVTIDVCPEDSVLVSPVRARESDIAR